MAHPSNPRFTAWECIGCGRIEAPQPCLGICQDRAVELVLADDYQAVCDDNALMRELLVRLARTHPHDGQWEAGYRALQARANELLDSLGRHGCCQSRFSLE